MENNNEVKRTQGDWEVYGKVRLHSLSKKPMQLIKAHRANGLADIIGLSYGQTKEESQVNAEFICKAVNSYDSLIEQRNELLQALKNIEKLTNNSTIRIIAQGAIYTVEPKQKA